MQPTRTQISGSRIALLLPGRGHSRGFLSILVTLVLLLVALPCAALFGCHCPCSPPEGGEGRGISPPASCCGDAAETSQTLSLPAGPHRDLAAPAIVAATIPDSPAIPFPVELPRAADSGERLYDPPPLFLLLCTLLN